MSSIPVEDETVPPRGSEAFDRWLEEHGEHRTEVWLKLAKKGSGIPSLTSDGAVDVGLCFGWIPAKRLAYDDTYYLQRYVSRRPRSNWSELNVKKVAQLQGAGRMRPSGLAEVDAAKADGRWPRPGPT